MRALSELAGVIVAGFAAFFGGILFLAGLVLLWLCGIASALFLMIAAFAGVMYAFTGSHHAAVIALGYLGYAAVPFVVTFVLAYYHGKLSDVRQQRQSLAQDASFTLDAPRELPSDQDHRTRLRSGDDRIRSYGRASVRALSARDSSKAR